MSEVAPERPYVRILRVPRRPSWRASALRSWRWIAAFYSSVAIITFIAALQLAQEKIEWSAIRGAAKWSLRACIILFICDLLFRWWLYVRDLEFRANYVRRLLLRVAGINADAPVAEARQRLHGITAGSDGTVRMLVYPVGGSGLDVGSELAVVDDATVAVFGRIRVETVSNGYATAVPFDRNNPEFWEHLEDRMRRDTTPPPGVHLEANIPDWIRYET